MDDNNIKNSVEQYFELKIKKKNIHFILNIKNVLVISF